MRAKTQIDQTAQPLAGIVGKIGANADPGRAEALRSFAREMLGRAPTDFFSGRSDSDLLEMVTALFELLEATGPDELAVRVTQRADNGHAGSVEVIISDRPFVVDTLRQALTAQGFEIRRELHPVVVVDRDESGAIHQIRDWTAPGGRTSLAYCEFEGNLNPEVVRSLEDDVRTSMADVRLATDDFDRMLEQLDTIAEALRGVASALQDRADEIREIIEFLNWLKNGGFIFLGYREYDVTKSSSGLRMVELTRGSGLGILRREESSSLWEPKPLEDLPPDLQARALFGPVLLVSKANSESRVHRRAQMDYVGVKKLDEKGEIVGEQRFLGLFTWKAYSEYAGDIPILRQKLQAVLDAENVPEGSHDFKAIQAIFNSMPKEALFLIGPEDLRKKIAVVMAAEDTGDVRLQMSPDVLGRGANVMVILPERNYSDEVRSRLRDEVAMALGGTVLDDHLALGEGETARLHFYVSATPERIESLEIEALEERVASIVRTWKQRVRGALDGRHHAEEAHRLADTYLESFTADYMATIDVDTAVEDIERVESLERSGHPQVALQPYRGGDREASVLRLFVKRGTMILADVMPTLENLGLRVIEADAMDLGASGRDGATIHTFVVQGPDSGPLDLGGVGTLLSEAVIAARCRLTDDDRLNHLVIRARLGWQEVAVLRAYAAYAFQIGAVSSRRAVLDALTNHAQAARLLFELFRARLDPAIEGNRTAAVEKASAQFRNALQRVEGIGDDLTFRRLRNLVEATVRTSYFQNRVRERPVPCVSFKFDCVAIEQLPHPRPAREMYVHGVRTEGAHLRFGPVARGGIRWSERTDDFRTEVLGLVKTQQVKNSVIVPVGAKGAFVVRRPPAERDALEQAVLDSYRDFISGLLDLTDNIVEGEVVSPPDTVVYDGEDPYLVVAADKGTTGFSDTANELAAHYGFWMGDAFASGGSHGYDHKKEAITARGVWECVRRHFREMDKDIAREPMTVVGIGDMSGDVFGNGMLLSRSLKLLAAFDHRHIFIDPDPDPEESYKERKRLFEAPGSSWADYEPVLISQGGGVYPRGAKEIHLSPEAQLMLDLDEGVVNGQVLIRAILRMPAELLWNGGVGTYVKASSESHAEVGNSSNDAVRIDASELRVRVVGEGGNLGLTQAARIEYALAGGRLDTDAVDNSAGVAMSDHEVNLKILLHGLVDRGELSIAERNDLLQRVNDQVAAAVLANNRDQTRALSLEQARAAERLNEFRDAISYLEHSAGLDRALESLPSWETLQKRLESRKSLTRPEFAVLLAYSKMQLKRQILDSSIPDDPALLGLLRDYFPAPLLDRVSEADLRRHRLQREIIATVLTSRIIDFMGSTFVPRVSRDTGATPATVARGWYVAAEIAGATELVASIQRQEDRFPAEQEYEWLRLMEGVLDRTVRWAVTYLPEDQQNCSAIEAFKAPVAELCEILPSIIVGSQREVFEESLGALMAGGVPRNEAQRLAALRFLEELMEITRISRELGVPVSDVGRVYFALADEVDFAWLLELLDMAPGEDEWEQRAALGLMQDLGQARRNLTRGVLTIPGTDASIEERLELFRAREGDQLAAMRAVLREVLVAEDINLAALTVATREILWGSTAIANGRL